MISGLGRSSAANGGRQRARRAWGDRRGERTSSNGMSRLSCSSSAMRACERRQKREERAPTPNKAGRGLSKSATQKYRGGASRSIEERSLQS